MIAVISDIHGNYPALEAVVEDIKKKGIHRIISLGDVAGYYCFINECIELCRKLNIINILGNHDYYLISNKGCPRSYSANICLKYQMSIISNENRSWLEQSEKYIDTDMISFRHGGWSDPLDEYIYDFSFDMVAGRREKIFVSGHTHKQVYLEDNKGKKYLNPGSVGQPRDYDPHAAYATIDDHLNVTLHRVEYPIIDVINKMKSIGMQDRLSECLLHGTKIGEQLPNL